MTSNDSSEQTPDETSTEELAPASEAESDEDESDEDDEAKAKKDKKKAKDDKKKSKHDDKHDKKVKIGYEAAMPRDEAVSYFESLVAGLRSGHLEFRQDDQILVLAPPDQLEIEVSAQQKGDKGKVSFEISWSGHKRGLAIVSDTPEPSEAPAATAESTSDDD